MSEEFTPAYEKLGYVALNVSHPERSADFYERHVGLTRVLTGAHGEVYLRCGDDHHNIILFKASRPGLKRAAFALQDADALAVLRRRLFTLGVRPVDVPPEECAQLRLADAIRISDPFTGATLEFYVGMQSMGWNSYHPTVAKIQRLGHMVLATDEWAKAISFYTRTLGFRLSDVIEGKVGFLRCPPNPLHHSLGVGNAPRRGLHHVNFMVTEIDDIGRALSRFKKNGIDIVFGPGRHPPSESVFLYFLDPDGLTLEYSFGMEEFPAQSPRTHRVLEAIPSSLDTWDSPRDPRHGKVGDLEPLVATS